MKRSSSQFQGILLGLAAYGSWGLLPLYWKVLRELPALEILAHRIVWSLILTTVLLALRQRWQWVADTLRDRSARMVVMASALLLCLNWFVYIWAVNAGFIVEASLGYFMNPLVNVLLGVLLLGERIRRWQWVAIALAASGVLYLSVNYGSPPWIALTLAVSFGFYGLLKKKSGLAALESLSLEMLLLLLPFVGYLFWLGRNDASTFLNAPTYISWMLVGGGVVTAFPLIGFAAAARRLPLSTLGILQYVAPTMQLLLGVFVYHEPFALNRLWGFSLVWMALAVYTWEGIYQYRRRRETLSRASLPLQLTHSN